jgi:hypothetical protein
MGVVQPPSRAKREAKKFESFALGVAEPPLGQMGWLSHPYNFFFFFKKASKLKKKKKKECDHVLHFEW